MDSKVIDKNKVRKSIDIKGAEMHNLKSIDLKFQKTISSYYWVVRVRKTVWLLIQFMLKVKEDLLKVFLLCQTVFRKTNKPKVKTIDGLSPAIAIEQRVNTLIQDQL